MAVANETALPRTLAEKISDGYVLIIRYDGFAGVNYHDTGPHVVANW